MDRCRISASVLATIGPRMTSGNRGRSRSISLAFRTDTTAYDVLISATGGDPWLILPTDTGQEDLTLTSLGGGYHTYDLTYNSNTDSADLAVNGTTVLSNWGGTFPLGHSDFSEV